MPFSNTEQISPILAEITRLNPRSILDVGCGLGVYGMLCRIHLDLYHDPEFYRKLDGSQSWHTRIDGIEGCETYLPFIPRWAYNDVYPGNALDIIPTLADGQYDLVLILAMIEHLDREAGIQLLTQLKRVGQAIILSVPKNWQEQQIEGYPLETHRSHWTEQDLRDVGFTRFLAHWGAWLAVYGIPPNPDDGISEPINSISTQFSTISSQITRMANEITELRQLTKQIQTNSESALTNQQVICERLSISSRIKSFGQRVRQLFIMRRP
jgi:hypothetical protein